MYELTKEKMVDKIMESGAIFENQKQAIAKAINEYWEDKIAIVWQADDIIMRAKERDIEITEEKAKDILQSMHHNHDCELGITWMTIDCYLEEEN